ncbi:glycosyltransferase [Collinsella sp. zg1085]|uniref:glycosyltransferase family 2 protein n=1 Tax=Collinsella sp. zg1085 TaxID=2844380 RepID=UPI001C0BC885|nr:glycosyltransferase family 2 protein [Collinsella sp. zg1085]QWT18122.1 glycosyltransferase [Collinsella sp. zg1085]
MLSLMREVDMSVTAHDIAKQSVANTSDAEPLVSIILPCYGVEAYLADALAAIQAQSYSRWELLAIDDASPDKTGAILAAAAAQDSRIHVLTHEKNQGLSAARNTGLAAAQGEFVWMPDPDDVYEPDLLRRAVAFIEQKQVDILVFGCVEEYMSKRGKLRHAREICPEQTGRIAREDLPYCVRRLEELTLFGYAWNKLYRRSCIADIRFETIPLIEDFLFNLALMKQTSSLATLAAPLYHYRKRAGANLTNRFVVNYFDVHMQRVSSLYYLLCSWGDTSAETHEILGARLARYMLSTVVRLFSPGVHMPMHARHDYIIYMYIQPPAQDVILDIAPRGNLPTRLCARLIYWFRPWVLLAVAWFLSRLQRISALGFMHLKERTL